MKDERNTTPTADGPVGRQNPEFARAFPTRTTTLVSVAFGAVLIAAMAMGQSADAPSRASDVRGAEFAANGEVKRPDNWRSWVFIGANLTPNGLNDGKAIFPEFHYTYIEPSAWAYYKRTGRFAEGTQIVKELVLLGKSEYEDGSTTGPVGRGFYAGKPIVLAYMYKDSKRFPDKPGGWGYFDFGSAQPYRASAMAHANKTCASCHELAKGTDYVFTQHYPVLLEKDSAYAPSRHGRGQRSDEESARLAADLGPTAGHLRPGKAPDLAKAPSIRLASKPNTNKGEIMSDQQNKNGNEVQSFNEYAAIEEALEPYISSAKSGDGNHLRTAFYDHAQIVGSQEGSPVNVNADTFAGIINDAGGSPEVQARISWIDISGPAAAARVEFLNWGGFRYTDFVVLYKSEEGWKISGKVYDSHTRN